MRSDIFDEYCKIMVEKGFVKEASETDPDKLTEEAKIKDKEYKDTIQALYGLKIKTNDSDKSVLEQAHPGKLVIAPSYDRVNGLVEDLQERHNIMVGIVNKMPNGAQTQHRYAEKALLDELIRLGFSLDNAGEDKLCKVADECALRLTNQMAKQAGQQEYRIKKQAWAFLLNPMVWKAVAVGVGAIAAYAGYKNTFGENISEGIIPDAKKALSELQDVQNKVVGLDKKKVDYWVSNLNYLLSVLPAALNIVQRSEPIPTIRTTDDAVNAQEHIEMNKRDIDKLKEYDKYFQKLSTALSAFAGDVANMKGSGSTEPTNEIWKTLEGVWEGVVGSDFSEARRALVTLAQSLNKQIADFESLMTDGAEKAKEKAGEVEQHLIKLVDDEKAQAAKPSLEEPLDHTSDYESKLKELENFTFGH